MFPQVGNDRFFEGLEDAVGIILFFFFPIDLVSRGAEMGDGGENVEAFMSFRSEGGVGAGGSVEVEGEVLGQDPVVEDVVEQSLVAGAEPDGVVGKFRIGAVGPEIDEKKGHAVAHFFEPTVGPFVAHRRGDFLTVEIGHIGVRDDHLGAKGFPGAKTDSGHSVIFDEKLVNRSVEAKLTAQVLEEFDEGLHEGAGAPHGKVHAPLALEVVDHGVDRRGLERVAANEKGMERENFPQALVFHVAASHLPNGTVGAETDKVGGHPEHVGEMGERLVGQFDEGPLEDGMGFADEAAVAFEIVGGKTLDLRLHVGLIASVLERIAVVPDNPVKRVAGNDPDIVGGFFLVEGKKLIQEKRGGEDGGAGIVGETLVAKNGSAAAWLFQSLEEGDLISTGLQANGGSQAPESGSNHDSGGAGGGVQREDWIRQGSGGSAERGKIIEIEDIKPGGNVIAVGVGGFLVGVHPFPLVDGGGGSAVHEVGPSLDLLTGSAVFLVFLDPGQDFPVAESAGHLSSEGDGVDAGKFQKIMVEGAVEGVVTVFFGQGGPAFVQDSGQNDVTAQPNPGTAWGVAGQIGCYKFRHRGRMP